tara:strand:+ start:204932 stop:206071 length:1140 start_codon:yes stop_codon:yes gene_type:complete
MNWQLIESDAALEDLIGAHEACEAVIVDTEFMRRNTFFPQVALLQMSFAMPGQRHPPGSDKAWLVDPVRIQDTSSLKALWSDASKVKVLHSASEDLEVFQHWLGVLPRPLFDTQRAAALVGHGFGLGYRALVQTICEVDLDKGETCSDWLQRPLTTSQCDYAAQDVTWLLPVWRALDEACREQGRLDWVLSDGRDALESLGSATVDYHRRIKLAWKLDRQQLGVLAALCQWREETARERDKPRSWIIDDKACLQLAQSAPRDWPALKSLSGLPAPAVRRYGDALLELIERQSDAPSDSLPEALPKPLDSRQREVLKKMKAQVRDIAAELQCAPEVLLQSKDYELLLRDTEGADVEVPPAWLGWRSDLVLAPLRKSLGAL